MKNDIYIQSVKQLNDYIGYGKIRHPLLTWIDLSQIKPKVSLSNLRVTTDLYTISLKEGNSCNAEYGEFTEDFQEACLSFIGPRQEVYVGEAAHEEEASSGWLLSFHRDFLLENPYLQEIEQYTFFKYSKTESLHVSAEERYRVTKIVQDINLELSRGIDELSQKILSSYLSLLLNYCKRFYSRQFITRSKSNKVLVLRLENFLKDYFKREGHESQDLLTVKKCAKEMGYTANYLSDLLKKETGKTTQEYIYLFLIQKAKDLLNETDEPVQEIAEQLGFDYPQHFSKLFKSKTGLSPSQYRIIEGGRG